MTTAASPSGTRERTILIAEGDTGQPPSVHDLLQRAPDGRYRYERVASGAAVLARAAAADVDCLLLDAHLPDGAGLDVLARLRERDLDVAVVMVTDPAEARVAVEAMKRGADDYLLKDDLSVATLERAVRNAIEKRALRRQLAAQERRTARILDTITEGFITLDADLRYTSVNRAAARGVGRAPEDLIGRTPWEVFGDLVKDLALFDVYRQVLAERVPRRLELFYPPAGLWTEARVAPTDDGGLAVLIRDIDFRKRTEESLRASEQQLRTVLDALPVGVWLTDANGAIVLDNPAGARIWGERPEGQSHRGRYQGWRADTGEPLTPDKWSLTRTLANGEAVVGEVIDIAAADGSRRTILSSTVPLFNAEGGLEGAVVVNEEITAIRQAEQALRASEARFRAVFEHAPTGIAITDWQGRFQLCNPAYAALLGYSEAELRRIDVSDLIHPDDREANLALIRRLQEGDQPFLEVENRYVRKSGEPVWVRKFVSVLTDTSGRPDRMMALVTDITDRKRAEQRERFLADLRERLDRETDPDAIFPAVTAALADHLGVAIVNVHEVDVANDRVLLTGARAGMGLESGVHPLSAVYGPETRAHLAAGHTVAIVDVRSNPFTAGRAEEFERRGVRSCLAVPLMRDGRWVGALAVAHNQPRTWDDDLDLVRTVTERAWLAHDNACLLRDLRESEERLRLAAQVAGFGYYDDRGAGNVYWSPEMKAMFGLPSDAMITAGAATADAHVHPEDRDRWRQALAAAQDPDGDGVMDVEHRILRPDGTVVWVAQKGRILFEGEGASRRRVRAIGLTADITARKLAEEALAQDLRDTGLLRDLATRVVSQTDVAALYQEILDVAITLTRADAGTVQIYEESTQELALLATRGFDPPMVEHFRRVDASSVTSCGVALARGERIVLDFDAPEATDTDGSLRLHVAAGYRSAQSTPLLSRTGRPIGMVSTHWQERRRPAEHELRHLDLLARQAADLIEGKQIELALREREELLRTLLESTPDLVWAKDRAGRITLGNRATFELLGEGDPARVLGRDTHDLVPDPEQAQRIIENDARVLAEGRPRMVEESLGAGEHELVFQTLKAPLRDATGAVVGIVGVSREVTAAKRAEDALRRSEERYRDLFTSMDEGFCVIEMMFDDYERPVDYRFLEINPTFSRHTGLVDAAGRTARELLPDLESHWFEIYGRVALTGEPTRFVNGSDVMGRWFDVYAFRVGDPAERKVALLFTDITERRRAEAERERRLAAEQAARVTSERALGRANRLQALAAALAAALTVREITAIVLDTAVATLDAFAGGVQMVTGAGTAVEVVAATGFASDLVGRWQTAPLEDGTPVTDAIGGRRPLWLESPAEIEQRYPALADVIAATGAWAMAVMPLRTDTGGVVGAISLSFDAPRVFAAEDRAFLLTVADLGAQALERARLYEAEQAARAEAEASLAMRDELMSFITHDLSTPVTTIRGHAQLLTRQIRRRDPVESAGLLDGLASIEAGTRRISDLVQELMDTTRLEAGRPLDLEPRPTDVIALARACVAEHQRTTTRHQLTLAAADAALVGNWDARRLERVLDNLLSNAIKYSPEGGPVTVTVRREPADTAPVNAPTADQPAAWAVVAVADRGIGIPAADLPHAFERFRRGGNVGQIRGAGIGLAGVKQIVVQHGGAVAVESAEGEGTTITVRLPLA